MAVGYSLLVTIDVHTHIFPSAWPDFAARYGGDRWPRLDGDPATGCRLYLGTTLNRTLTPHAFDPARRLEDMDRTGVERQLLTPAPPTFCYWAPGPAAAEWCRMQNDALAELVSRSPSRFLGAGGLPPQAPILGDTRFRKNNLTQAAGFPLETALCMTRVIFGSVLERWPTIRWCFA